MSRTEGSLSIPEASALFDVSTATLRRRISRGELKGAFKAHGKRGLEWRVPVSSLKELGYEPSSEVAPDKAPDLQHAVRNLTETLQAERARWEEWDRRLGGARAEIARLEAELRRVRDQLWEAQAENERLKAAGAPGARQVVHLDPLDPHRDHSSNT